MPISHFVSGIASNLSPPHSSPCSTFAQSSAIQCRIEQSEYSYLAGIHLLHIENHFRVTRQQTHTYSATYVHAGILRYTGDKESSRQPITTSLLRSIKLGLSGDASLHALDKKATSPTQHRYQKHLHLLCRNITLSRTSTRVRI